MGASIAALEAVIAADLAPLDTTPPRKGRPPGQRVMDDPLLRWAYAGGGGLMPLTQRAYAVMSDEARILWQVTRLFGPGKLQPDGSWTWGIGGGEPHSPNSIVVNEDPVAAALEAWA